MDEWCASSARDREEPLAATASRVERWLLVEHTGPWGPESVPTSRMPVEVSRALAATARAAGARLLVIRRHQRTPVEDRRQVYAVESRPGLERVLGRTATDEELLDLEPRFGSDPAPGWEPVAGPLLLVCTHGRHDRCCAVRGRPVAQALDASWPETTWECSHIGGDRFAANLLVLPDGLYLGRVEAAEADGLVRDLLSGTLPAGRLRGRSSHPLPTQAAQQFAREQLGRWGAADLPPVSQEHAGPECWRVRFGGSPGVEVVVRYDRAGDGRAHVLTCGADEAKVAALFRLVDLEVLAPV